MIDIGSIPLSQPLRIIIGAGEQRWPGWLPTQKDELDLLHPDDWEASFYARPADAFLCEHVWEHSPKRKDGPPPDCVSGI